jgi:transposase
MTAYCGVDFHARQQTIAYCDSQDGEIKFIQLRHDDRESLHRFYTQFQPPVVVGLESGGYSDWFERFLEEIGIEAWFGNPTEIRRRARSRQKNDWRDAELLLDLLLKGEFPRVHRQKPESRAVLVRLRYRHKLVQLRTKATNSLHALAIREGLTLGAQLLSKQGRLKLMALPLAEVQATQRQEWLEIIDLLSTKIRRIDQELCGLAQQNELVQLVRTHPGIGVLTGLALVHTLAPVSRFRNSRKVTAYVGLEPREFSSDNKQRWGGISKAGSPLLRFLLVEAAQQAARHDSLMKNTFLHLSARRGRSKARVAVARKLLVRAYILLRDEIDYATYLRRTVAVGRLGISREPSAPSLVQNQLVH